MLAVHETRRGLLVHIVTAALIALARSAIPAWGTLLAGRTVLARLALSAAAALGIPALATTGRTLRLVYPVAIVIRQHPFLGGQAVAEMLRFVWLGSSASATSAAHPRLARPVAEFDMLRARLRLVGGSFAPTAIAIMLRLAALAVATVSAVAIALRPGTPSTAPAAAIASTAPAALAG